MHADSPATRALVSAGRVPTVSGVDPTDEHVRPDAVRSAPPKRLSEICVPEERKRLVDDGAGGVVLWVRRYNPARKAFEPYVCLGRLQVRLRGLDSASLCVITSA
jgi:hypothetical protein